MRLMLALLAALPATAVAQQPDPARKAAERALFEKIVEIPTVEGGPPSSAS
jgi:hypothetical protein